MTEASYLVTVAPEDGLLHHGAYFDRGGSATVVQVRGEFGSLYENARRPHPPP